MTSTTTSVSEEDASRREEEWEALLAIYGEDEEAVSSSKVLQAERWSIKISEQVTLDLLLPPHYPSEEAPAPKVQAPQYILNDAQHKDLIRELMELWTVDTEVAILWAEHCRMFLEDLKESSSNWNGIGEQQEEVVVEEEPTATTTTTTTTGTHTFVPPTSKFGQPVRHFDISIIHNDANQRVIHHGPPFRPPKSGPSEILVAHVAGVSSMDHVNWVLAELLSDKKIAKASHNMIAYKFTSEENGMVVSDNDDDGEKGSGAKLAALLELTDTNNVIVVVSRWYGGIHLGAGQIQMVCQCGKRCAGGI